MLLKSERRATACRRQKSAILSSGKLTPLMSILDLILSGIGLRCRLGGGACFRQASKLEG